MPGPGEIVMESSDSTVQSFALGTTISIHNASDDTATLRIVGAANNLAWSAQHFPQTSTHNSDAAGSDTL